MTRQRAWEKPVAALFAASIATFFFPWLVFCLCVAAAGLIGYFLFASKPHRYVLALIPRDTARHRLVALLASSLVFGAFSSVLIAKQLKTAAVERQVAAANRQVASKVTKARSLLATGKLAEAEQTLKEALEISKASDRATAEALLVEVKEQQVAEAKAAGKAEARQLFGEAMEALEGKDVAEAVRLLRKYVSHPYATEKDRATTLLAEADVAMSDERAVQTLEKLNDDQFGDWKRTGRLPSGPTFGNATLSALFKETLQRNVGEVEKRRETARVARVAREEKERRESEERKRREDEAAREAEAAAAKRVDEEKAFLSAKAEFEASRKLKGVRELVESAETSKEDVFKNRFMSRALDGAHEVVKTFPNTVAAADAQTFIDTKKLPIHPTPPDPDDAKSIKGNRLPDAQKCLDVAAHQAWAGGLQQIPATVIDKGDMRHVPYQSFRAGDYEVNIYGDPDHPVGLEIGIYKGLLRSQTAKAQCVAFMVSLLPDAGDRCVLKSLKLTQDVQKRGGLTFEVTPETAEDAYDGWWISVYDTEGLNKSRATPQEIAAITVEKKAPEKSPAGAGASWSQQDISSARPGGARVYVHAYTKKDGTYVAAHTRAAPGTGSGKKR